MKAAASASLPPALSLETWPIDRVTPYARNPRRISQAAIDKVAASIKAYGWRQPIVVDRKGVIIVGHTRHAAALQLGMTEVPVHVAADMTAAEAKAYRLADNRTNQEATWADDLLAIELSDLKSLDFDLSLTGFSSMDLETLFGDPVQDLRQEWEGMPEFHQEDNTAFRTLKVHFADQAAVDDFAALISQNLSDRTRYVWFPEAVVEDLAAKRYVDES